MDFESIGFFTKNPKYKFNQQLERTITFDNSNRDRDVGKLNNTPEPQTEEHYASYPTKLVERMMRAGTDEGDIVYDPFGGTATTALIAHKLGRQWICSELQPKYTEIASKRLEPHLAQYGLF